jgi:Tfp pilus assembly protein FimT
MSLLELLVVVSLGMVVSAIAVLQIGSILGSVKGDGAMRVLMAQVNTAREFAISQRRLMEVQFISPNYIRVMRHDVPSGTTMVSSALLESGAQFQLVPGVPDTPDAFGNASPVDFGSDTTAMMFSSDGTLIDQAGVLVNGTVFIAFPPDARSARAVSVLGSTGRVRGYSWNGTAWSTN